MSQGIPFLKAHKSPGLGGSTAVPASSGCVSASAISGPEIGRVTSHPSVTRGQARRTSQDGKRAFGMAQRKRAGPITPRSQDRNLFPKQPANLLPFSVPSSIQLFSPWAGPPTRFSSSPRSKKLGGVLALRRLLAFLHRGRPHGHAFSLSRSHWQCIARRSGYPPRSSNWEGRTQQKRPARRRRPTSVVRLCLKVAQRLVQARVNDNGVLLLCVLLGCRGLHGAGGAGSARPDAAPGHGGGATRRPPEPPGPSVPSPPRHHSWAPCPRVPGRYPDRSRRWSGAPRLDPAPAGWASGSRGGRPPPPRWAGVRSFECPAPPCRPWGPRVFRVSGARAWGPCPCARAPTRCAVRQSMRATDVPTQHATPARHRHPRTRRGLPGARARMERASSRPFHAGSCSAPPALGRRRRTHLRMRSRSCSLGVSAGA